MFCDPDPDPDQDQDPDPDPDQNPDPDLWNRAPQGARVLVTNSF